MSNTVYKYRINATRPDAPSEDGRNAAMLARRSLGGAAIGSTLGAVTGAVMGKSPSAGALVGASVGTLHGALRGREAVLSDRLTQERMAMRQAQAKYEKEEARAMKERTMKEKSAALSSTAIHAMQGELAAIHMEKQAFSPVAFAGGVGKLITGAARRGAVGAQRYGGSLLAKNPNSTLGRGLASGARRVTKGYLSATKAVGGSKNLNRVVGGGALAASAGYGVGKLTS